MTTDNQTTEGGFTMTLVMHKQNQRGRTVLRTGEKPTEEKQAPNGRTPRVSRMMALAIHLQKLLSDGGVHDCAEIARLAGLTRARVSQIMNLNLLVPRIQEDILFMPKIHSGHDPITERHLRTIAMITRWDMQLKEWSLLTQEYGQ